MTFDVDFDFLTEVKPHQDADTYSRTLRVYHRMLWSKPLPSGRPFTLATPSNRALGGYLTHEMPDGSILTLGSDAFTNSWSTWIRPRSLVQARDALNSQQRARFLNPPYTIGQSIIWPLRTKDGSINTARVQGKISDRIDLTLECVRRHYAGEWSPLAKRLDAYTDYFALFDDFAGYVRFFLLDDLVDPNCTSVLIPTAFDGFKRNAAPATLDEFVTLREATLDFIERRQRRMVAWAKAVAAAS
mgnify:CR=1 FL=1